MANTSHPRGLRFHGTLTGEPAPALVRVALGSGVPIKVGDPVYISSGYGQRVLTTQAPFGIAVEDVDAGGTGAARAYVNVIPCAKNVLFKVQTLTGTAYAVASHLGNTYGVGGSSGVMGLNLGVATTAIFRIVDLESNSTVGSLADVIVVTHKSQFTGDA